MSIKLTANLIPQGENPDVVIVGGGPIGLWTGIQTSILSGKKVTIIEKYNEYRRSEIRLNISSSSFAGMVNDPYLRTLVDKWKGKLIPIKELESALSQRANELGIKILKGYEANPKTLTELFPSAKIFIGADGARSIVRKEIFQDEYRFNTTQQYMAQVQYIIKDKEEATDSSIQDLSEKYRTLKFAEHVIYETVKNLGNGTKQVRLQILIDKETYDQISDSTFKNPYYFETDLEKIPPSLQSVLKKWWGSKKVLHDEEIISNLGKTNHLTAIALGSYAARDVVKKDQNGKVWLLVGDSAAAFPYFRAINNGLLLGTKLAKNISNEFKAQENKKNYTFSFHSYSRYATIRFFIEKIRAFLKNLFLNLSKFWINISSVVPWQMNKFSKHTKAKIEKAGSEIWTKLSQQQSMPNTLASTLHENDTNSRNKKYVIPIAIGIIALSAALLSKRRLLTS